MSGTKHEPIINVTIEHLQQFNQHYTHIIFYKWNGTKIVIGHQPIDKYNAEPTDHTVQTAHTAQAHAN